MTGSFCPHAGRQAETLGQGQAASSSAGRRPKTVATCFGAITRPTGKSPPNVLAKRQGRDVQAQNVAAQRNPVDTQEKERRCPAIPSQPYAAQCHDAEAIG